MSTEVTGFKWLERFQQGGAALLLDQSQRVFNDFRRTYNHIRPHEALGDETPASRWKPSRRRYPNGGTIGLERIDDAI